MTSAPCNIINIFACAPMLFVKQLHLKNFWNLSHQWIFALSDRIPTRYIKRCVSHSSIDPTQKQNTVFSICRQKTAALHITNLAILACTQMVREKVKSTLKTKGLSSKKPKWMKKLNQQLSAEAHILLLSTLITSHKMLHSRSDLRYKWWWDIYRYEFNLNSYLFDVQA